ncbi:GTP-binding protein [Leisingera daeponensis]|uniref:GTP-binding protein n=1 Tax=Leisingera daeponensis TaxID=405746 RepID=A0ABS7NLM5_9RHOB|nr:CobW family GTP-binding protein [Leisingera daeponensis]MBY6142085.1 GTP-binding protein [Leisingera daeponensis]
MSARAPLPVNVICGYLGAGKTTLLNRLLTESKERIIVMVNDFGDIAVDAALVSARSADTIQLSNGCICCSMAGGMFDAFERALSLREAADRLVIEASGVAEPARLTAFARAEPDLDCRSVVVVVDPFTLGQRLQDDRIGGVVRRQIEGADVAYLSRSDRKPDEQSRKARARVMLTNPSSAIHYSMGKAFLNAMDAPHVDMTVSTLPGDAHADLFSRATVLQDDAPEREGFLDRLRAAALSLHRAKGFVRFASEDAPSLVQLAGGEITVCKPPNDPGPGPAVRLVLIGTDDAALRRFQSEHVTSDPQPARSGTI